MKALHIAPCLIIAIASGLTFVIDLAIGSSTHASSTPQWTQTCTISPVKDHAELTCPNKYQRTIEVSQTILPALKTSPAKCSAYRTHAFNLDVVCGP